MHLKTLNLLKQNPKWVQIMDWSILLEFPSPYPQKVMKKKDDDLFKKFVVILKKVPWILNLFMLNCTYQGTK